MHRRENSSLPPGEAIVVEETGLGRYQLKVRTGSATFLLDEPIVAGGLGSGPNPYDLLSAALAASTVTTLRTYAVSRQWSLEHIRVRLVRRRPAGRGREVLLRQIILLGALDENQRAKLLKIADQCPIHASLKRGFVFTTELLADNRMDESAITRGEHMLEVHRSCDEQRRPQSGRHSTSSRSRH
jgi:putative redox protein